MANLRNENKKSRLASFFHWLWKWIRWPFSFFQNISLNKVEAITLYLVLVIHFGIIFEFFIKSTSKLIPETWVAVVYIIAMSVFWSYVVIKKTNEEKKKLNVQLESDRYNK